MNPTLRRAGVVSLLILVLFSVLFVLTRGHTLSVFHPAGQIAMKERNLMYFAMLLSLLVVIPVFTLTVFIGVKYRSTNKKAPYQPEWDSNRKLETLWWCIPLALILVLSVVTWNSSHQLDPYRPLVSQAEPLTIQVVALDWKWLFIYPDQNIATVNTLHVPVGRPVNFQITSDGAMNSFWIPQLGGQIYAMAGMTSQLHLTADKLGTYRGVSANISGDGFAGMKFDVVATGRSDFDTWVSRTQTVDTALDSNELLKLELPTQNEAPHMYASVADNLFHNIVGKYMSHTEEAHE